jgi:UDPglucose--hexose-1-phosphate uridylyltransferase
VSAVRKTATRLADGRELLYFDDTATAPRLAEDRRPLPARDDRPELRHDPLVDEWVIVAGHRQERTHLPPTEACPLCPSASDRHTEIPEPSYDVVVFENRYPSLAGDRGRCEVVCFTDDHGASFVSLPPARVRTIVDVWADRTEALGSRPDVEYVFCFENRGVEIGVTLHHPHGQIYGYPFLPPRPARLMECAARHRQDTGRDLFDQVVASERRAGSRVVVLNDCWTGFVPAAARWPFEVHLYPHRPVPDLPALEPAERDSLASIYLDVLGRVERVLGPSAPYVAAWYQAPARSLRDAMVLHLEVFSIRRAPGKLKYLAGSESAMGVWINDVAPEEAARLLRDAGPLRHAGP